jgi:hypothetical protein
MAADSTYLTGSASTLVIQSFASDHWSSHRGQWSGHLWLSCHCNHCSPSVPRILSERQIQSKFAFFMPQRPSNIPTLSCGTQSGAALFMAQELQIDINSTFTYAQCVLPDLLKSIVEAAQSAACTASVWLHTTSRNKGCHLRHGEWWFSAYHGGNICRISQYSWFSQSFTLVVAKQ